MLSRCRESIAVEGHPLHRPSPVRKVDVPALVGFVAVEPATAEPGSIGGEATFLYPLDSGFACRVCESERDRDAHADDRELLGGKLDDHGRAERRFERRIPSSRAEGGQYS